MICCRLKARADKAKADGNTFYQQKEYTRALQYYTQAIGKIYAWLKITIHGYQHPQVILYFR